MRVEEPVHLLQRIQVSNKATDVGNATSFHEFSLIRCANQNRCYSTEINRIYALKTYMYCGARLAPMTNLILLRIEHKLNVVIRFSLTNSNFRDLLMISVS